MIRPFCIKCKKEMFCKENGALLLFEYSTGAEAYLGDIYQCENCGNCVILDFGDPLFDEDARKLKNNMLTELHNPTIIEVRED